MEDTELKLHALSDIENEYRDPRPKERKAIAEKLGVSEALLEQSEDISAINTFHNHSEGHHSNSTHIAASGIKDAYHHLVDLLKQEKEKEKERGDRLQEKCDGIIHENAMLRAELHILKNM